MTTKAPTRGRARERGEGNLKIVLIIVVVAIAGYLAVKNIPTYIAVQNMKHDLQELARGSATMRIPPDRVKKQAIEIVQKYDTPAEAVTVVGEGKHGIKITVSTVKEIDLLVTKYEWPIEDNMRGAGL
jgi:hypothetical protein